MVFYSCKHVDGESRHSREGSGSSAARSGNSHSRQNSRDKGNHSHSRQGSQELVDMNSHAAVLNCSVSSSSSSKSLKAESKAVRERLSPSKNIEIYATLPKSKKGQGSRSSPKGKNLIEDEEYLMKERPGRSLLGNRSKSVPKKDVEKRTRSEERSSKSGKEVKPAITNSATTKDKEKELKDVKKHGKLEEKQNKKQHKIRRKLLMGGLMRRKNRSMPDLREDENDANKESSCKIVKETSKDDSMVDSKTIIRSNLSAGYLSEGNLEYAGNPNLERSKLMRKSFHGSKLLQLSKVPPPPPLRTTSQLSKTDRIQKDSLYNAAETTVYANSHGYSSRNTEPSSLPLLPPRNSAFREGGTETNAITYSNGGFLFSQPSLLSSNTLVTKALIHNEPNFQSLSSTAVTDKPVVIPSSSSLPPPLPPAACFSNNKMDDSNFQLPPYPSPIHSALHSRQASEEFPPPPMSLPISADDNVVESTFLAMLRDKCEKMSMDEKADIERGKKSLSCGGESWLRELQIKQAERKRAAVTNVTSVTDTTVQCVNDSTCVKDLKCRFEQMGVDEVDCVSKVNAKDERPALTHGFNTEKYESFSNLKSSVSKDNFDEDKNADFIKRKTGKKKNVTFCEQVVLVATADDEESDGYIPNPILERVLRTVLHKETNPVEGKEHAVHSVVPLKRTDSWRISKGLPLKPCVENEDIANVPALPSKEPKLPPRTSNHHGGIDSNLKTLRNLSCENPVSLPLPSESSIENLFDEVDGGRLSAPLHQEQPQRQSLQNQYQNQKQNFYSSYAASVTYSPTYMSASSICAPSEPEYHHKDNEYSATNSKSSALTESVDDMCHAYLESYNEKVAPSGTKQVNRKSNYSPVCHREISSLQNGSLYSGYSYQQCSSNNSSSYQPMSLQYYPSQHRFSPQIHYKDQVDTKSSPLMLNSNGNNSESSDSGGTSYSSSLMRQNSNVNSYIRQPSPSHDAWKVPTCSVSPVVMTSSSSPQNFKSHSQQQYFNDDANSQKINSGPLVPALSNFGSGGSNGSTIGAPYTPTNDTFALRNTLKNGTQSSHHTQQLITSQHHSRNPNSSHQTSMIHHHSSAETNQFNILNQNVSSMSPNIHHASNHHQSLPPNLNGVQHQQPLNYNSSSPNSSGVQQMSAISQVSCTTAISTSSASNTVTTPPCLYPSVSPSTQSSQSLLKNSNGSTPYSSRTKQTPASNVNATSPIYHSQSNGNVPTFPQTSCGSHMSNLPHHTQCSPPVIPHQSNLLNNTGNVAHQLNHTFNVNPHAQNLTNSYQTHHVSSNSSSCDSLSSRPSTVSQPYQSVPHNSPAYELHTRSSSNGSTGLPNYQHVSSAHSSNTNCPSYQSSSKVGSSYRSNVPPVYQHPPPPPPSNSNNKSNVYQRVPTPNQQMKPDCNFPPARYSAAYHHSSLPKPVEIKKTNGCVAITGGNVGAGVNNSIDVVPCNLCRKKQISPPSVYCADCDFYISRFKQKI